MQKNIPQGVLKLQPLQSELISATTQLPIPTYRCDVLCIIASQVGYELILPEQTVLLKEKDLIQAGLEKWEVSIKS
jgi:hypothetical protein